MPLTPRSRTILGVAAGASGIACMVASGATAVMDRAWIQETFPSLWKAFLPLGLIGLQFLLIGIRVASQKSAPVADSPEK